MAKKTELLPHIVTVRLSDVQVALLQEWASEDDRTIVWCIRKAVQLELQRREFRAEMAALAETN